MKLNMNKYFEEAKKNQLSPFTLTFSSTTETTVEVFNGEVETQQIGTMQDIGAKALYDGKLGSFVTDAIDSETASLMAKNILESARFGREEKAENFYAGGKKYRKAPIDLPDFKPASLKEMREAALTLCKKVQEQDSRINKVTISLSMSQSDTKKGNTLGLKCGEKSKYFSGYIEIVAENEEKEPRSGGIGFYSFHSLEDLILEAEKKLSKLVSSAVDFFQTGPCASKKYKAVLDPSSVSSLLSFYMMQLNAKAVHKHLSVFENKVGEEIMSKALTIKHTPHTTCISASSYDADGYPTQDFTVIQRGVLKNYFQSYETANEEHIESNGCSDGDGNASPVVLTIKEGKKSLEDLFQTMKNGIYITSISGLNSGINAQTLDYSLPCQGYLIKDGKVDKAVSMIVCAGNLKDLFESVIAVGDDTEYQSGIFTPSILFKNFAISGK